MMNSIKLTWFSFWYAIAFLTRIPAVNLSKALKLNNKEISQGSLYFYPLIGLIIGLLMSAVYFVCAWQVDNSNVLTATGFVATGFDSSSLVIAALMLLVWCLITGGLHLDGLADAADAWVGGYGDKQRTLDIMKDPTVGPMGAMLVVLVLLLKFSALVVLVDKTDGLYLVGLMLTVPMLARFSILPLLYFTPYVREKGLGSNLKQSINPIIFIIVTAVCMLLTVVFVQQKSIFILILAAAILLWARNIMMQRIEGTTGDTAGAMIEVQEALLLCALVL
ncbi:MAG: adenosylcobinamide-GDP ribazoletransferase [Oleispira sp.]|nr:adenosylcobinamide-GDP ribazoletransferase [Oleispira sp.]